MSWLARIYSNLRLKDLKPKSNEWKVPFELKSNEWKVPYKVKSNYQ